MNETTDTGNPSVRLVYFDAMNSQGRWTRETGTKQGICSFLACHGPQNPDWYGVDETLPECATCHTGALDPLTTNGIGTDGKHLLHVTNRAIACLKCHFNYTNQATHMNGTIDTGNPSVRLVYFDQTNPSGQWTRDADPRTGQCSSVACHGAGTPDWYNASSTLPDCTVCHSGPYDPLIIDETEGGNHSMHVGDYAIVCMKCHYGYTNHPTHMNGQLDISIPSIRIVYFDSTNSTGQWNSSEPQAGSCTNLYCHSDATSPATGTIRPNTTPRWDATGFPMVCTKWTGQSCISSGCHMNGQVIDLDQLYNNSNPSCSFCHGMNTPGALSQTTYPSNPHKCYGCHMYPPSYATDAPKSNSHQRHAGSSFTCNYCHYATTKNNATITDASKHANGAYDVIPDPTAVYQGVPVSFQYTYDNGGGKCFGESNSCHIQNGMSGDRNWGGWRMDVNAAWSPGTSCYQVNVAGSVSGISLTSPYTYAWDFGDGTASSEQNATHIYPSGQNYTATLSIRDAKNHLGTKTVTVKPATPNIPPVLKLSFVSISGYTVTVKDESYDPDYNQCGHSGPATLTIKWNDPKNPSGSIQSYSVNLTDTPSNTSYTYTYNSGTTTPTAVGIYYEITDNAGAKTTPSSTLMIMIPERYVISGTIATAGGTPVSGVYVARKTTGGISIDDATTSSTGYYSFSNAIAGSCYLLVPGKVGYTFTPSSRTVCEKDTSLNFTAVPKY